MKINEILKNITNIKQKALYARSIRNCNSVIKKAISDFYSKGSFEPVTYRIKTEGYAEILILTTTELQDLYGMKPLESLLFLDAISKADASVDKTALVNLLQSLTAGKHYKGPVITQQMLDNVKATQPEVWAHYQDLCDRERKAEDAAIQEMTNNLDEEI